MVSPVVDELKLLLCASRRCERPQMTPFPQRGKVSVHPLKVQDCVIRKRIIQFYGYLSITKTPLERVQRGRIGKASISGSFEQKVDQELIRDREPEVTALCVAMDDLLAISILQLAPLGTVADLKNDVGANTCDPNLAAFHSAPSSRNNCFLRLSFHNTSRPRGSDRRLEQTFDGRIGCL